MTQAMYVNVTVEAAEKADVLRYIEEVGKKTLGVENVRVERIESFPSELWPGGPMGYTYAAMEPK